MDSHLWTIIIVAVLVIAVGFGAKSLFGSKDKKSQTGPSTHEHRRCACGWEGQVSRFVKKCPKCGSPV